MSETLDYGGEPHEPARAIEPGAPMEPGGDPPASAPDPSAGAHPPQGEHHAAGGLGGGHPAPPGWPDYGAPVGSGPGLSVVHFSGERPRHDDSPT
jgi:hypothetical protein